MTPANISLYNRLGSWISERTPAQKVFGIALILFVLSIISYFTLGQELHIKPFSQFYQRISPQPLGQILSLGGCALLGIGGFYYWTRKSRAEDGDSTLREIFWKNRSNSARFFIGSLGIVLVIASLFYFGQEISSLNRSLDWLRNHPGFVLGTGMGLGIISTVIYILLKRPKSGISQSECVNALWVHRTGIQKALLILLACQILCCALLLSGNSMDWSVTKNISNIAQNHITGSPYSLGYLELIAITVVQPVGLVFMCLNKSKKPSSPMRKKGLLKDFLAS